MNQRVPVLSIPGHVFSPIRLDEAVMETDQAWAASLRRMRHIGDFRAWKDHGGKRGQGEKGGKKGSGTFLLQE
jgi:hypothetical protein